MGYAPAKFSTLATNTPRRSTHFLEVKYNTCKEEINMFIPCI